MPRTIRSFVRKLGRAVLAVYVLSYYEDFRWFLRMWCVNMRLLTLLITGFWTLFLGNRRARVVYLWPN